MSVTLGSLRARVRLTLADVARWPDATLDGWLGDAIRFYSVEFPRALQTTLVLVAGVQAYELPAGCQTVTAVEYPAGETPARFVTQAAEWSGAFRLGDAVYALRGMADGWGAVDDYLNQVLVFAEPVVDGESGVVAYLGLHRVPAVGADDEFTSVPESHVEALLAFVEFCAYAEIQTDAVTMVDITSDMVAQLGVIARRAWTRYKEVTARLQELTPVAGGRVVWGAYGL